VFDVTNVDLLNGKLVLRITENRPWQQIDVMHRELGAKVKACVRYIRSQDFADEYNARPGDAVIRLVAAERPAEATRELLQRIRYELAKHDIEFECTVAGRRATPLSAAADPNLAPSPKSQNGNGRSRLVADVSTATRIVAVQTEAPPAPRERERPAAPERVEKATVARPATITAPRRSRTEAFVRIVLLATWLAVAGPATLWGLEYYLTPIQERAYSELHEIFKPSGTVGILYGTVGSVMIVIGTAMYSLRKRFRFLQKAGRLTGWLQFHIFLCTLGPYLVLLHSSFKFAGVAGFAFWSMVAVAASGVLGRYLFAHIPGTINSRRALVLDLERQQKAIVGAYAGNGRVKTDALDQALALGRQRTPKGLLHAFVVGIRNDLTGRWLKRKIKRRLALLGMTAVDRERVTTLVLEQIELKRRVALLEPFQRMFAYWHVVHLPMSTVMCVSVCLHIIIAVLFGYANFF
jgi:hypothetical protein